MNFNFWNGFNLLWLKFMNGCQTNLKKLRDILFKVVEYIVHYYSLSCRTNYYFLSLFSEVRLNRIKFNWIKIIQVIYSSLQIFYVLIGIQVTT